MEFLNTLTVAHRFHGPPFSGNGGDVCGMLPKIGRWRVAAGSA